MRSDKSKSNGVKKFYLVFILPLVFIFIFQAVSALASVGFNQGLDNTGRASGAYNAEAAKDPGSFLARLLGKPLAPLMIGVTILLLLFYGGYTLLMSRGNEQEVEKAKSIIINTIIGALVLLSAYIIVTLITPLWEFVTKK